MQWREVALGVIGEQLSSGPYQGSGRIQLLQTGKSRVYTYNSGANSYNYCAWEFGGYLFCLDDNMTWMLSPLAEQTLNHVPAGTYWLLDGKFVQQAAGCVFMHTHGSLKKFELSLDMIINKGRPNSDKLRLKRMRVEV